MPNTAKELIERKERRERRICAGSRVAEWILVAMLVWAAVVMVWTPFLLHAKAPFFQFVNSICPAWAIAIVLTVVAIAHGVGLLGSHCPCHKPGEEPCGGNIMPVPLRQWGANGQVGSWLFLWVMYALFCIQAGELPFGSGVCFILLVVSGIVSYCVSQENARLRVRRELFRRLEANPNQTPQQIMEGLERYT